MSSVTSFSFFKNIPQKLNLVEEKLSLESDIRLFRCLGVGSLLGIAFLSYALTVVIAIPIVLGPEQTCFDCDYHFPKPKPGPDLTAIIPRNIHGPLHPGIVKHPGTKKEHIARTPRSNHPVKVAGILGQKLISSTSLNANLTVYDLVGKTLKNLDQNKLNQVSGLSRTDETRLSGRMGKKTTEFNLEYNPDGTGEGNIHGIPTTTWIGKPIAPSIHGDMSIPPLESITMAPGENARSTAAILTVIRSHSPGLRHIYNTYLRMHTGMKGKVTLRFAISPSGQVVDVGQVSSSTESTDFDTQISEQIMSWRFEPVKSLGNDLVTVPFNFSE